MLSPEIIRRPVGAALATMRRHRLPTMNCDSPPHPVASVAPPALDERSLAGLRALDPGGGRQLLRRVFDTYLTTLGKLRRQLDDAQGRGEPAAMQLAVHTLKSSSANVGALSLSRLCTEAEQTMRDRGVDSAVGLLERLRVEADRVEAEVRRLLVDLSGS